MEKITTRNICIFITFYLDTIFVSSFFFQGGMVFTATRTSCGTWDSYIPVGTIENFDHLAQVKMEHYGKSNTGGKNIVHNGAAVNQYTNEMVKWLFKFT